MTTQPTPPRVYVVTHPGEDIEAFATLSAATQHARDVCSHWDDHLDWSEVESFAGKEVDGKLHTSTVETPDGVLVLESCEVRGADKSESKMLREALKNLLDSCDCCGWMAEIKAAEAPSRHGARMTRPLDLTRFRSCALAATGHTEHLHPTQCSCEYCCFATVFDPETCVQLLDRVAELEHRLDAAMVRNVMALKRGKAWKKAAETIHKECLHTEYQYGLRTVEAFAAARKLDQP